jgi:hypothetical protein
MRIIYSIVLCMIGLTAQSQQQSQSLEINNPGSIGGNYGQVRYFDPSQIGKKNIETYNYADIKGTPFWDEHWNAALLFLKTGAVVKAPKVRLNAYTNDVHYMDSKGMELAAEPGNIKKIILFKGEDTTKVQAVFESFADVTNMASAVFYKVLNAGNARLLELDKAAIKKAPYDPLQAKTDVSFFLKYYYAVERNGQIFQLKSLDKNAFYSVIYPDESEETCLKANKNKLKNAAEIVSFLNYYNQHPHP